MNCTWIDVIVQRQSSDDDSHDISFKAGIVPKRIKKD